MKKESAHTKRQMMREKRQQRQRMQRLALIGGVLVVALVIAAMIIIPNMIAAANVSIVEDPDRPYEDGPALGLETAPVVVEVFEDFQCIACKNFSESVEKQIAANYVAAGQVRYIYRQFPILDDQQVNKYSDRSAMASMCAAEQNRFWDYHDSIFANFGTAYTDPMLTAIADKLGLDMNQFRDCFRTNRFQAEINEDIARGESLGVSGTPSVFVNGQRIGDDPRMVPSYETISAAIEAALP